MLLKPRVWPFLLRDLTRRALKPKTCPCCGSSQSTLVDRKLIFTLEKCAGCKILYRFPYETPDEMAAFYQRAYQQKGLTTDLPTLAEVEELKARCFRGTSKDATPILQALAALGIGRGSRVLDFGANWGYTAFQMRQAGLDAEGYEVSMQRARFGRHLGLEIETAPDAVGFGFDAIYSGHVLEHVPNPCATLSWMLDHVRPGGFVLGHTPNGSAARQQANFASFHLNWGIVHPVLLSSEFLSCLFPNAPRFTASTTDPEALAQWGGRGTYEGPLDGAELFFVVRR